MTARRRSGAPVSVGDALRMLVLADGHVTQDRLAAAMGVTRYSVNQLINHRRNVTAEMALRLGKATNTTPEFWLNIQREVDLYAARRKLGKMLGAIRPVLRPIPKAELFLDTVA
jgi:addiction module HigA family antidote